MSWRRRVLAGIGLCALAGAAMADDAPPPWRPYAQVRAWAAYDAVQIGDLDGDWADFSPRAGRNVMLQRHRAEIGVERGDWRLGWEYRQEATLAGDRRTLEFVQRYKQRAAPPGAASYVLAARLERWSAQGPRLGRWFGPAEGGWLPRLQVSGALYTRAALRDTEVAGTVDYTPADQYAFNAGRTELNSSDRFPFMRAEPGGAGASISVAMAWRLSPALTADANIDDLWSAMRFRNLPIKEERINSQVGSYDADGYINYGPRLTGSNRQATIRRALGRTGAANLHYDTGPLLLSAGIERLAGISIPSLAVAHQFSWGRLSTRIESRFKTIGFGIDTEHLNVALQADTLQPGRARALGVSVGVRY